ncbi:hypothetical protein AABB24_023490 [Solanum stoloniferum]|uniref:Helicase ATP-binding domain-containing protein n=1 Tax=Solanum stoloniferum TaxID=62892 RepID=A0ABD2SJN5_9SOLN
MKRDYYEISDDEWPEDNSFNPSRVLKHKPSAPPPPIESFAYSNSTNQNTSKSSNFIQVLDSSSEEIGLGNASENLEDDDAEIDSTINQTNSRARRRFVVDDEEEGFNSNEEEEEEFELSDNQESEEEEEDVVGKALQKCGKISMELKRELFGTAAAKCDSFVEVEEASSLRIVTQDDIDLACGEEDSDFKPILKPYQLVGVNFLLLLYRKKIGGAILADEMGLGKTIQAITYLTLLKHLEDDPGPHLIVCPASVLENWERELKKWCPAFTVIQYHGSARSAYSKDFSSLARTGQPPPFNVILVCYSLFERHSAQQKDDRKILKRWRWSCVLMDEAHALKDKGSYRWKNLMSVARNANQRLMLTGTPLQNDLHEMLT